MERLRPDGESPSETPVFGCSSIHDMVTSRPMIIEEVNRWAKEEATGVLKFFHYASQGRYLLLPVIDREYCRAYVELTSVTHDPAQDRASIATPQITLTDGITEFPVSVGLPSRISLRAINRRRRHSGLPDLNNRALRDNFWTANVTLFNVYSGMGSKFTLSDFEQIEIPGS